MAGEYATRASRGYGSSIFNMQHSTQIYSVALISGELTLREGRMGSRLGNEDRAQRAHSDFCFDIDHR